MMFGLSNEETLVRLAVILALKRLSLKMDGEPACQSAAQSYNRIQRAVSELHTLILNGQLDRRILLSAATNISAESIRFIVDIVLTKNEDKDLS
jgi:hypothetical protein